MIWDRASNASSGIATECALISNVAGGMAQVVPLDQFERAKAEAAKQGQILPPPTVVTVAPCTFNPKWENNPAQHWCRQWQPARIEHDA